MNRHWRPSHLIAPTAAVIVAVALLSGWICYRVGVGVARGELRPHMLLIELAATVTIILLALFWLAHRLRRQWIEPVQQVASTVERLAGGAWDARSPLPAASAAGQLFANQLNYFAEQVQTELLLLQQQRTYLTTLVESLPDPILLTDPQQRVILINEPAARFLSMTPRQAMGQKLISILGEASLVDVYESLGADAAGQPQTLVREIRAVRDAQKHVYQSVVARTGTGGVLLVLRDVSRLAATVQMKTDFVANASHELRTPIAAIKIAFETLCEVYTDDPDQSARCIEIIGGHMQRLEAMLQDLLDLSRVENVELKPEYAEVRGTDLLASTRSAMGSLARNKKLDFALDGDAALVFQSDRKLLDLIMKNLVENSIKYTPEGGRVMVNLRREERDGQSQLVLSVTDTGIGIPPQHLDRVFERFYQVDSARSGSAGRGTGLGLAIVKHAAAALGAQVAIDSTVGRGTTVTCTFPEADSAFAPVDAP